MNAERTGWHAALTMACRRVLVCTALWMGVAATAPAAAQMPPAASIRDAVSSSAATTPVKAVFGGDPASPEVAKVADWVVATGDNRQLPFMIIDKKNAKAYIFKASGLLGGAAPVLLGLARGDDSVPGIGTRTLSSIRPEERTTPAGRFVANLDRDLKGEDMLWVDYDTAISLHRVVKGTPGDRRLERLATPTPLDNRISFGCINVPARFFDAFVRPAFTGTDGIVYVLPETRSTEQVFGL